jgi:hypothetical protein
VEQEFTLGKKQVPAGLEEGVRDMKAGAERLLLVPPELGWSGKYRAAALQQIKSCGATCPLDEQAVVVLVKLEGYKKAECLGVGDLPIQANIDAEKATISLTIGSDTCPEGNVEVMHSISVECRDRGRQAGRDAGGASLRETPRQADGRMESQTDNQTTSQTDRQTRKRQETETRDRDKDRDRDRDRDRQRRWRLCKPARGSTDACPLDTHTHTHTRTHARTHARARTHTHTHTHTR